MANAVERVYRHIRTAIISGTLTGGSQIKEEEIAAQCGVSRTPVRDALRLLEAEMFVERSKTQRCFVSDWSRSDAEDLFALRAVLESYATERATTRMTADVLSALSEIAEDIAEAANCRPPDIDRFVAQNALFHKMILQAAGSERLSAMLQRLVVMPIVHLTAQRYEPSDLQRSVSEHREIIAAFEAGDPGWAGAVMTAHIRRALRSYQRATIGAVT